MTKPVFEFYRRARGYLLPRCIQCTREHWAANASEVGLRRTARRHSIDMDVLLALLEGGCGVCGTDQDLTVDHDHSCCPGVGSCGRCIRGALCRSHNMALGKLGDNLDGVMRLVHYLEDE